MADEEIVAGLGRVESQLVQQRTEDSKQTSQLSETINSLRAENSQKSDNLANVITTGLERNASELASDRAILQENQAFLRESGVTQIDDKVDNLTTATTSANTEQKSFLQRIAAFVNPDMQGSKDRERDLENKLNFNTIDDRNGVSTATITVSDAEFSEFIRDSQFTEFHGYGSCDLYRSSN